MGLGRIGGALIVVGCLLLLVAGAISAIGGPAPMASLTDGGMVVSLGIVLLSLGLIVVGVAGARPFDSGSVRAGLVLLGLGALTVLATSNVSASSLLVIVYLAAALVALIGAILAEIGLLLMPGRPRRVAIAALVGLGIAAAAGGLVNVGAADLGGAADLARATAPILADAAGVIFVAALATLGVLSIRASGALGSPS